MKDASGVFSTVCLGFSTLIQLHRYFDVAHPAATVLMAEKGL
jgi:hypothetical protein